MIYFRDLSITIWRYSEMFSYLCRRRYDTFPSNILDSTLDEEVMQFVINGVKIIVWRKYLQILVYKITPFIPLIL